MDTKNRDRLIRNGRDQSLTPREFEVEGRKKENNRIIRPAKKQQILSLLCRLDPVDDGVDLDDDIYVES